MQNVFFFLLDSLLYYFSITKSDLCVQEYKNKYLILHFFTFFYTVYVIFMTFYAIFMRTSYFFNYNILS